MDDKIRLSLETRLTSPKSEMADISYEALEVETNSFQLKPEDIPGAVLKDNDIGKWTVKQLQFWLRYRRVQQKGNKKELIER